VSASFPRHPDDVHVPFLLDLVQVQRRWGWDARALALHDAGIPVHDEVSGVPVRRAQYAPAPWEQLAYRGGLVHGLGSGRGVALLAAAASSLVATTMRETLATRPSVLHGHWLFPGGLAVVAAARLAAALRRGAPRAVVMVHGSDVELAARAPEARRAGRWVAARAEVVAVSDALAARTEAVLGLAPGSVTVARLPLAGGLQSSPLPPGPYRLLAAGRASPEKGLDVLVAALAAPEAAGWQATLCTEGPDRPALERAIEAGGLADRVTLLPLQPRGRLFDLVRAHHLVVVPSRAEGLGMMAVEALALGRPVVASAVGGLVELVGSDDGALVPAGDPDALAKALATVCVRPPLARATAAHHPDAVREAYTGLYCLATDDR